MNSGAIEREWPTISRQLTGLLAMRGVPLEDRADLVQEVALRLLATSTELTEPGSLSAYASAVARNLHTDFLRREARRRDAVEEPPGEAADVERVVAGRLHLAAVLASMHRLGDRDRGLILDALAGARSPLGKERIALHRARRRLRGATQGTAPSLRLAGRRAGAHAEVPTIVR